MHNKIKMDSRTYNSKRNILAGFLSKAFLLLCAFVNRTVFIRILGVEYTGISSLFSNILSVLNLADLGMGSVLAYELYEALKSNDTSRITSLSNQFKKIYRLIILVVIVVGIILIPFLQYIIKSSLEYEDVIIYYLLYLLDSVASYFVVYRTTVIIADQKAYITNVVEIVCKFIQYLIQIIYISIFHEFLGYLIIQVSFTVINNFILHIIATKKYPYLKNKDFLDIKLINKKRIFKNIGSNFVIMISNTILTQTDSIIISVLFGTAVVGYYANYFTITTYVSSILYIVVSGISASVGNLIAENNNAKSYEVLKKLQLLHSIVVTFACTLLICLIQDFIPLWIGEQYVMSFSVAFAMSFYLIEVSSEAIIKLFYTGMGIFSTLKYAHLTAAFLNILLSVILGKVIGVPGVILATPFSRLVSYYWYDSVKVLTFLDADIKEFFFLQLKYYFIIFLSSFVGLYFCRFIMVSGWLKLILDALCCISVVFVIELIFNGSTKESREVFISVKERFKR